MNALCYKVIFSKRLGALVAVGENATSQGKSASGAGDRSVEVPLSQGGTAGGHFVGTLKVLFASSVLACMVTTHSHAAPAANTLPTGYSVNSGNVAVSTAGANMTIKQNTDKASVNWQSFSIGSAASVNIQQNSASSVLLNRVVGNDPSQIFGKLTANGQVILINPNGIVFGKGGSVTASAFTASTFGMSEEDFKKGKYKYDRNGSKAGITVEEGASINTTVPGGYVALISATVNNQGNISTKQGPVILAAGESVALPSTLTDNVGIPLSGKVRLELAPSTINASVENGGTITTEGGQVLMQAAAVADAVASVTHTGAIDTTGAQGGAVTLLAEGGHIKASGSITANSIDANNKGGDIIIGRDEVTGELAATTDVSGAHLESKGGFVETSGHDLNVDSAQVKAANWLLDPDNIDITGDAVAAKAGFSKIKASDIANALNAGTSVTVRTTAPTGLNQPTYSDNAGTGSGSPVAGDGNIEVNAAIVKSGSNNASLTLLADNGITVNQRIGIASSDATSTGKLDVTMNSGGVASATGTSLGMTLNNVIDANAAHGGTVTLTGTTSNATQNGVTFANGSGINAAKYTVAGTNTSTSGGSPGSAQAAGVLFRGTTNFTSSTGASTVTGDTRNNNGYGVQFYPGNATLDAGTGSLTVGTASTSVTGMRSGWGGNSTINTKGNVTLGSKNNDKSDFAIQGVINAQSGALTLLGKSSATNGLSLWDGGGQVPKVLATNGASITMNGESTKAGSFGVILAVANKAEISSDTGAISITGTSSGNTGIYTQNNTSISSSNGGNITLTGNATGTGGGVGLNLTNGNVTTTGQVQLNGTAVTNIGVINNAAVTGGSVSITGTVSGNNVGGVSVSNSGTVTATAGNVNITGSSGGATSGGGVYSSAAITSNTGDVNITGTTLMGGGVTLQGTVTAQNNVNINGTSSGAASTAQGVVIQNAIKANTGDITVTGNTNSNVQRAVAVTVNGANNGSLQTVASGRNININADTLLINTGSTVDSGSAGTVTIKTTSNGGAVSLGAGDTWNSTPTSRVLGLDQGELNAIKAGKLIIGDTTTGGNIRVASAVTTADTTGNLFLKTAGNVNIDNNLTVGTTGGKNLSIEATGTNSTVGGAGTVKANELKIKGSNATVAMATAANQINTISADVKSLAFKNGKALSVGTVFAGTNDEQSGITTTGVTSLTGAGSVTQTSAAAISADGLELLGDTADFTLDNASNAVNTIAANTKSVSFTNSKDLVVDQVNNTVGVTTAGATNLKTTQGNLTLKKNITATNNTVSLNIAGSVLRDANVATDGIIKANALKIKANNVGISANNRVKTETSTLAMDTAGDQYVSEADGVTLAAKTSGGKIDVETRNGTLTVGNMSDVDGANIQGLTTTGSGDITLSGNSTTDAWGINVTSAVHGGGDIKITGQSNTGAGTGVSANVTGNQSVEINGTSNTTWGLGVQNGAIISANGPINLTGTTGDGKDLGVLIWGGSTIQANAGAAYADGSNAISIRGLTPTNSTNGGRNVVINSNSKIINNSNNGDTFIYGQNSAVTFDAGTAITNANTAGKIKVLADNNARVDATDPSAKITQNSNKGISIVSNGNGDVVVPSIVNNGTGDVVIAAGSTKAAGDGSGGQVKTSTGQTVTNNAGKTYIYTGNASDTGKLENLMGSLDTLYLSKVGDNAQNAQLNTAYANSVVSSSNTIQNGAAAQVMFRENTKFDEIQINPATLTMNAGQVDPSTASFAAAVAAANTNGAALTKASITENKFKISTDAAGIAGTLPTPSNQARTTGTYDYATTSSIANKVTSSISSTPAVKLVVQASNVIPVPTPVVPTSNTTRVKVPAGSANPFALASAESLVDDVCSANSLENCHCEESSVNEGVNICYEPNAGSK
jgi:filamentous hemagglutinin family protein